MKRLTVFLEKLKIDIFKKNTKKKEDDLKSDLDRIKEFCEQSRDLGSVLKIPEDSKVEYINLSNIMEEKKIHLDRSVLKSIYPEAAFINIDKYLPYFIQYMDEYKVNTPIRAQMFFAQIGHESGRLRYVEEIASGSAYEGRKDLGNVQEGDGIKFKGRGLIQITGRSNYQRLSKYLDIDLISNPTLLLEPKYAVLSAYWFWEDNKLNQVADTGDFRKVTRIINGGFNGLADRERIFKLCKKYITYA